MCPRKEPCHLGEALQQGGDPRVGWRGQRLPQGLRMVLGVYGGELDGEQLKSRGRWGCPGQLSSPNSADQDLTQVFLPHPLQMRSESRGPSLVSTRPPRWVLVREEESSGLALL